MAVIKSDEQLGSRARLQQRIVVGVAIAAIAAVAVLLISAIASQQRAMSLRHEALVLERDTTTVLLTAAEFTANITDAQSAERGFLLTRNPAYLDRYETAWSGTRSTAAALQALTADNARQVRNVPILLSALEQRRQQMDELIDLARREALDENRQAQLFGNGKTTMDALRARVAVIVAEEQRLLSMRRDRFAAAELRERQANWLLFSLGGLLVGLFALTMFAALRLRGKAVESEIEARALARMANLQALLQLVIDSSGDPICVKDRDGRIVYANASVAQIYDVALDKMIGAKDADLLPPQAAADLHRDDEAVMMSGQSRSREVQIALGGEERIFLSFKTPWREGDEVVGVIGTSRDITSFKHEEQRLQDSNSELEARVAERTRELRTAIGRLETEAADREAAESHLRQMQKMESIGQLSGGIAHDFNNMLAIVVGSLDLARKKLPENTPDSVLSNLDDAHDGASRAAALTARLLAYARQQPLAPVKVDCNSVVKGVCDVLGRTLEDRIELHVRLGVAVGAINIDVPQLENAIINIAVNSRDAMPDGGRLLVETDRLGDRAIIRLTDTGTGMAEETVSRAFDPFYTTKEVGKGTGMGLSQVQGFIAQSGGEVTLTSQPGIGTTVEITLPMIEGTRSGEPADAGELDDKPGMPSATILVVEDEALVRKVAVAVLEDAGHIVCEAGDGAAALELLSARHDIELMMTDIAMPRMDGRELAERARKARPDLCILFTTGYDAQAGTDGAGVLQKPYLSDELLRAVENSLSSR